MFRRSILFGPAAALVLAGCGGGEPTTPPSPPPSPGIHFITTQNVTDTVDANGVLTIEVRDAAGGAVGGQAVSFEPQMETVISPFVLVAGRGPGQSHTSTTQADGRVSVNLTLGAVAGAARIVIRVPALGFADTARFTIIPGAPAQGALAPKDSTVYVGGGYTPRSSAMDRHGNPRVESVECTAGGAVSVTGCTLRGDRVGRGFVAVRVGTGVDTAWVSVVPEGVIAAYDNHLGRDPEKKTVRANLDGSGIVSPGPGGGGPTDEVGLAWSPDGQELALVSGGSKLQVLTPGSPPHNLIQPASSFAETAPRYSRDGTRVFFTAWDGFNQSFSLYRAARDGTSPTRFGLPKAYAIYDYDPSPSPDGRYVVYITNRGEGCSSCGSTLRIWDLQTSSAKSFSVNGELAAWSPVSDLIAYAVNSTLRVIHADGTGDRLLLDKAITPRSIDWSPDGKWVLITTLGVAPRLVEVATGQVLPIAWAAQYSDLAWRP